jgi:hypothetical protein
MQQTLRLVKVSAVIAGTFLVLCTGRVQGADCVDGNLKDNYLGKQCTVDGILFDIPKDGIGVNLNGIDPKEVSVKPVLNPAGLTFAFPELDPHQNGLVSFVAKVTAANKKAINDASLATDGSDAIVVESFEYTDGNLIKSGTVRVTKLIKSMEANLDKQVPVGSTLTALFVITPIVKTKPSFTSRFSQVK